MPESTLTLLLAAVVTVGTLLPDSAAEDVEMQVLAAEQSLRRIESNPRDEDAWQKLVQARLDAEDLNWAEKDLANWAAKVPAPSAAFDRLRGDLAFARKKVPDAIAAWSRSVQSNPKDIQTRERLAEAYASQNDLTAAIREISVVIKSNASAPALARRASYHARVHDWSAAEVDIKEANRLDAADSVVQALFPAFERMADWLPTVRKLDAAIANDPTNHTLRLNRAEWLIGVGLTTAGGDDVDAAFNANPKSLRARVWKSIMARERSTGDKAGEWCQLTLGNVTTKFETELKALDASPDPEARANFLLAWKQPFMALEEVKDIDGSPAKARALFELSRLPEAGVSARRAVELHPADASAWLTLAHVETANGNIPDSLEALKRSLKLKKSSEAEALQKSNLQRLGRK